LKRRALDTAGKVSSSLTRIQTPPRIDDAQNGEVLPRRPSYHLYDKETLAGIREGLKNKRVIILNREGTLSSGDEILPEAQTTLSKLKERGYSLVLWSDSSEPALQNFARSFPDDTFDLVVSEDNTREVRQFAEIVDETDWLLDEQKEKLKKLGGAAKAPHLLAPQGCLLEDPAGTMLNKLLIGKNNPDFPLVKIDRPGQEGRHFDLSIVPYIESVFPPQVELG